MAAAEVGYLCLVKRILEDGEDRGGRNGLTRGLFGERLEFDLTRGFPLVTTKRVFWRGVVEELLWFLRGSTDATELSGKGVHIWDANTSREFLDGVGLEDLPVGSIGQGYGFQWRCFGGTFPDRKEGVDQLQYVLQELCHNPFGRRALLVAWNPKQLDRMALPPCHFSYQFYLSPKHGLSCQMQMRSCDVGAGLPFNIASTALFTTILATVLHVPTHRVVISMGDTHLYHAHFDSAREQIDRQPYALPALRIKRAPPADDASVDERLAWIEKLVYEDFELVNYQCHAPLKYPMVA